MKKVLFCVMVTIFLLGLVGCSNSKTKDTSKGSDKKEQVELTFWGHQEESWNNSYKEIADQFMADNPDIKIKFEFFPYDQFESKVQSSLTSKDGGADIYEFWGGWGVDFAPTGALASLPEDMAKEIQQDAYEPTIGALEYEEKLYGMPLEFNIEIGSMLVNNSLLESNGLSLPNTWDELVASAKKATVIENGLYTYKGFDFVNWDSVTYLLLSMILGNGGQYLNEDGTVDFSSPQAIEAFEELRRLVMEEQVTDLEGLTGGSDLEGYQQLFAGRNLFVPRGPWTIAEGVQTFELTYGEDFQFAPLPWYSKDISFAAETGWSITVNNNSKQKEAAFRFLEYFFRDEVLLQHNINTATIPSKKSAAQSDELLKAMPYLENLVNILDKGHFIGYFNTDQVKEAINNAFVDYCQGVYGTAEEALNNAAQTINDSLK